MKTLTMAGTIDGCSFYNTTEERYTPTGSCSFQSQFNGERHANDSFEFFVRTAGVEDEANYTVDLTNVALTEDMLLALCNALPPESGIRVGTADNNLIFIEVCTC